MQVRLANATDLAGFRSHARALLAHQVAPEDVSWSGGDGDVDLFADAVEARSMPAEVRPITVPAGFLDLCESVVLHRDPARFALLYRLLWRLQHEPTLRHDPLDADMIALRQMARAVQHEIHKMRAFVRFRPAQEQAGPTVHVAWFEPEHHIVEANAPWFSRRFANMRWAILTPSRCVEWDGTELHFRDGARRHQAPPPDAGETLWLTYYQSIFNPARLNLAMTAKEMPRRYWRNLPESQLIAPLAAQAMERCGRMIEQPASSPARRIPIVHTQSPLSPPDALQSLNAQVQNCRECPLGELATQAVAGQGPLNPRVMLVGEQPGDQEDLRGQPFVGPAGELLDRALRQLGIERRSVYLTNAVRHFRFELRGRRRIHKTPGQAEALACRHWLQEEIALVRPSVLVALGGTAARALLGRSVAVLSERGQWFERNDGLRVLVTLHPSALLRMPSEHLPPAFAQFVRDLAQAWASERSGPGNTGSRAA
jgi:uracil-DNA glycosylase